MKGIKITTLCIAVVSIIGMANAETCIKTTYNVSYTCNGGTLSGTLPSSGTATYASSFTPTALTTSMCTPPSGSAMYGYEILVDGKAVAYSSSTSSSFTYYYTSDIEIGPRWLPIASSSDLAVNLGVGGTTYTYVSGASGTWQAVFPYGIVNGLSKCTTIKPENTAGGYYTGLIATDQSAIENAAAGGQYCYCKLTEPYIAASPWVFYYGTGRASLCASNCADYCGHDVRRDDDHGRRFRASMFAGAMAE